MTLHAIVAALGGDLYHGGQRANVPAPGHSAVDRSVSLMLSDGRVAVHSFGAADWRGCATPSARGASSTPRVGCCRGVPSAPRRRARTCGFVETASRLWEGGVPLEPTTGSAIHLRRRGIDLSGGAILDLRHHPAAPVSVYRSGSVTRPALMARISDAGDILTAVELTYLDRSAMRSWRSSAWPRSRPCRLSRSKSSNKAG